MGVSPENGNKSADQDEQGGTDQDEGRKEDRKS